MDFPVANMIGVKVHFRLLQLVHIRALAICVIRVIVWKLYYYSSAIANPETEVNM